MEPFHQVAGVAAALPPANIDTDQIMPKQFLRGINRQGLSQGFLFDLRFSAPGQERADFVLNRAPWRSASILLTGPNFGCGSSREHAPQALMRWGIRAVVGESFAEIFYGNCLALGIPCLVADHATMLAIQEVAAAHPAEHFQVDVAQASLHGAGERWGLSLAAGPQQMLVSGQWDATGQLLANGAALDATAARLPYLQGFTPA